MYVKAIFLLALLLLAPLHAAAAPSCNASQGEINSGEPGVGPSCAAYFKQDTCITIGEVYIKSSTGWTLLDGTEVNTPPTAIADLWDPDLKLPIRKKVYEFFYVTDLRQSKNNSEVVGVVMARSIDGGTYGSVSLYRNELDTPAGPQTAYQERVLTDPYQTYVTEDSHGSRADVIDKWMAVPGYDSSNDSSRKAFAYRPEELPNFMSKLAMKLRVKSGSVSCVPFTMANEAGMKYLNSRLFVQRELKVRQISAGFRCCSRP